MAKKSTETWVGVFVVIGILALVFLALKAANLATFSTAKGYVVRARFDNIGGLKVHAPVRSAGVAVGHVTSIALDKNTYQGVVTLEIAKGYSFPADSSAQILTSGLLGDQYVGIEPGSDDKELQGGDQIKNTQSAVVLEKLIGQMIFNKAADAGGGRWRRGRWHAACHGGCRTIVERVAAGDGASIGAGRGVEDALRRCFGKPLMRLAATLHAFRRWVGCWNRVVAVLLVAAVAGCATGPDANPKDPLEPFNRKMFAFNDALDTHLIKPVAISYTKVIPSPVRTGIHNFFGNFTDAWSAVNQLLQGKFHNTAEMTMRVLTNTVIGLGGILDPATEMGMDKKSEDLGQTFGRWGIPPGPYIVLPLFGPSDVRDAVALPADDYVTPALLVNGTGNKIIVDAVGLVDARANFLSTTDLLDSIALDKYTFTRDAYITRRRSLVYDGNPPDEPSDDKDDAPLPGGPASGAMPGAPPASGAMPGALPASGAAPGKTASNTAPPGAGAPLPRQAQDPSQPASAPSPTPGVMPAPLPASAPTLPVPPAGPVPIPPPPASAPR